MPNIISYIPRLQPDEPVVLPGEQYFAPTHNAAIIILETLARYTVISKSINDPPVSPTAPAAYIIGASPTGAWSGYASKLAFWVPTTTSGDWWIYTSVTGLKLWVQDEAKEYYHNGTNWIEYSAQYSLPIASATILGGIKVGNNLSIDGSGVLSAIASGTGLAKEAVQTASFTAQPNKSYPINTASGSVTITLDTFAEGDNVRFYWVGGSNSIIVKTGDNRTINANNNNTLTFSTVTNFNLGLEYNDSNTNFGIAYYYQAFTGSFVSGISYPIISVFENNFNSNNQDITWTNSGTTFETTSPIEGIASLKQAGATSHVYLDSTIPELNWTISPNTANLTIFGKFKFASATGYLPLFTLVNPDLPLFKILVDRDSANKLRHLYTQSNNSTYTGGEQILTWSTSTIYKIALTISGNTAKLYRNGTLSSTYAIPSTQTNKTEGNRISIWSSSNGTANNLADDFRIYNYALSDAEIAAL